MRNNIGFTLMELCVVIAIFAVVASLGVPSFIGWRNDAKLRDAASLLRGDLELAKLSAVRENDFVAVVFNGNDYTVFVDDGAGGGDDENYVRDGSEEILRDRQMPAGVRIDNTTFAGDQTGFNGRGRIVVPGIITLVNSAGSQRQVDINNRFGRITVN
jgi:type IV fimbrial biogenesis protein FimT